MQLNSVNGARHGPSAGHRRQHGSTFRCLSHKCTSDVPEVVVRARAVTQASSSLYEIAESTTATSSAQTPNSSLGLAAVAAGGLLLAAYGLKKLYDTPSRTYDGNVGDEYDAWTEEGILEYYWGEHIHLGYYTDEERKQGWWKADFKAAKLRFTEEMFRWSGAKSPKRILDVGCGFGGSSRWLASQFPDAQVTGITLSPKQVARATELAAQRGLTNVEFKVMDALAMNFADNTFDFVWACESGEHMPDKGKYVAEMARVLAPGGNMVVACWCQREAGHEAPLSEDEAARLQFLYDEWAHPFFISIEEFVRLMTATGQLEADSADWTEQTLPSWRHSNLVGMLDPWFVIAKLNPAVWYKVTREIVTLERMHCAFADGLMRYGMMRAVKKAAQAPDAAAGAGEKQPLAAAAGAPR